MGRVCWMDQSGLQWRRLYLKTRGNHTKTVILTALNMLTSNVLFYIYNSPFYRYGYICCDILAFNQQLMNEAV